MAKQKEGVKVHSPGYMQEKLRSNIANDVQRYKISATIFIRVSGEYRPPTGLDDRRRGIWELILYSQDIEKVIGKIERGRTPGELISHEIAEVNRLVNKVEQNKQSDWYYHLREHVIDHVGTLDMGDACKHLGSLIRETLRSNSPSFVKEGKLYVSRPAKIVYDHPTIALIENQHRKLKRRLVK